MNLRQQINTSFPGTVPGYTPVRSVRSGQLMSSRLVNQWITRINTHDRTIVDLQTSQNEAQRTAELAVRVADHFTAIHRQLMEQETTP